VDASREAPETGPSELALAIWGLSTHLPGSIFGRLTERRRLGTSFVRPGSLKPTINRTHQTAGSVAAIVLAPE
jgi:hypothetical protein